VRRLLAGLTTSIEKDGGDSCRLVQNTGGRRLDHVRPNRDIAVYQVRGADWVRAGAGGISTFASAKPWGGVWWRLLAETAYDDLLLLYNDHGDHWVWAPTRDMELDRYIALLAALNSEFRRTYASGDEECQL
jgi:hypothetical protein